MAAAVTMVHSNRTIMNKDERKEKGLGFLFVYLKPQGAAELKSRCHSVTAPQELLLGWRGQAGLILGKAGS